LLASEGAGSQVEHQTFLLIDGGIDLVAIEKQKDFPDCMRHSFVAIDERMIQRE